MEIIESFELKTRSKLGKKATKHLRREGYCPANIYGHKIKTSTTVGIPAKELNLAYKQGCFYSRLFELNIEGKIIKAFAKEVLLHPVKSNVIHVDFLAVDVKKKIKMTVPIRFINLEKSLCLKFGGENECCETSYIDRKFTN